MGLWHANKVVYFEMIKFIRKNKGCKNFWRVEVWRVGRHCNAFWKHANDDVFETYLGLTRALTNLEKTNMLGSNNKTAKRNELAQLKLYNDYLKNEVLVVSEVL